VVTAVAHAEAICGSDDEFELTLELEGFNNPRFSFRSYHDPWFNFGRRAPLQLAGGWVGERTFRASIPMSERPAFTSILVHDEGEEYEFSGPTIWGDHVSSTGVRGLIRSALRSVKSEKHKKCKPSTS
jgi:hypothetical protein